MSPKVDLTGPAHGTNYIPSGVHLVRAKFCQGKISVGCPCQSSWAPQLVLCFHVEIKRIMLCHFAFLLQQGMSFPYPFGMDASYVPPTQTYMLVVIKGYDTSYLGGGDTQPETVCV